MCIHTQWNDNNIQPHKRRKSCPVTTQMDVEGIILSEVSQTEKDKYCTVSFICGIFKKTNSEAGSRMVVARHWGNGGNEEALIKGTNLQF